MSAESSYNYKICRPICCTPLSKVTYRLYGNKKLKPGIISFFFVIYRPIYMMTCSAESRRQNDGKVENNSQGI